jgi:predicted DNA binding CopG/RHH family protein
MGRRTKEEVKPQVTQINLKIAKTDLKIIDEKARRYGMTRSALIKYLALNTELSYETRGEILQSRHPRV